MAGFWKTTSFLGSVGIALLVAAFFAGDHSYSGNLALNTTFKSLDMQATWHAMGQKAGVLTLVAAVLLAYQFVVTVLGLLAGFFGGTPRR